MDAETPKMQIRSGITTLYVRDIERSVGFYRDTLGLSLAAHVQGKWAELTIGPTLRIGLHLDEGAAKRPRAPNPRSISVGLEVTDISLEVLRLKANHVEVDGPILSETDPVRLAFFADPDGNLLYLYSVAGLPNSTAG